MAPMGPVYLKRKAEEQGGGQRAMSQINGPVISAAVRRQTTATTQC